jgi:acetoin utilization deacetylase AcuC-like enzyme
MHDIVFFYPQGHEEHQEPDHPERPERVEVIRQELQTAGVWDPYPHLQPLQFLEEDILGEIHDPRYLSFLKAASIRGQRLDADTYLTPASWELALNAAGGAVSTAAAVWQRKARRGFALTRPPGHHAVRQHGMGFCLINNVAAAAQYLVKEEGAKSLAILDLDLHHGNGTQDIFWQRRDVFYLSTHQSPLYPGTGHIEEQGQGEGMGSTANIPLPPGSGDRAFQAALDDVILPLLDRHQPEMLLVSYGFDTHWRDPLGSFRLSAEKYGELIAGLCAYADQNCQGRIALFLEGGYDLGAAAACSLAVTAALLDMKFQDPLGRSPRGEGDGWQGVIEQVLGFWNLGQG